MEKDRIFVEDIVAKMEGGAEFELKPNDTIRFEIGKHKYRIKIRDGVLNIYKSSDSIEGHAIVIMPESSNVISIK